MTTTPPFEIKTGLDIRLRSKKGQKNQDGSADWYLSVVSGKLVPDGGPNDKSVFTVTCNDDQSILLKSKSSGQYLGIDDTLKVIPNADASTSAKFELSWNKENGKCSLLSVPNKAKQNLTGKPGPHLGMNPKHEIIGNAGTGPWGQWEMVQASDVSSGASSALSSVGSPAMTLLTNLPKHQEMWNQRFYIDRQPSKSVKAVLSVTYALSGMNVNKWCVVAPCPPVIQGQNIKAASLKVYDTTGTHLLSGSTVIQAGQHHQLLRSLVKGVGEASYTINAKYEIEADLFSLSLKKLEEGAFVPPVNMLSPHERQHYLQQTSYMDFQNPSFQQWVQMNQLHPLQMMDGSVESLLCFAYRVFLFIKIHFSYVFAKDVKGRKASETIQTKTTDCGGFVLLFSSIMRMHGIPARLLCGRWSFSGNATEQKYHVRGEFYCDNVGWVPYDMASGITGDHEIPFTKHFGNDKGELIVMHLDHGIHHIDASIGLDKPVSSEFIQGQAFWVNGSGSDKNKKVDQLWTVQ